MPYSIPSSTKILTFATTPLLSAFLELNGCGFESRCCHHFCLSYLASCLSVNLASVYISCLSVNVTSVYISLCPKEEEVPSFSWGHRCTRSAAKS